MLIGDKEEDYIQINSTGLEYSTMMLISSVGLLYLILAANKFRLDKKVGLISLALYAAFLLFACLFELGVFFPGTNKPTCQYHMD
jgi:sodium/potassium/calcium exchanger 4